MTLAQPVVMPTQKRHADVVARLTAERDEALAQLATVGRQRDAAVARLRLRLIANIAQEAP